MIRAAVHRHQRHLPGRAFLAAMGLLLVPSCAEFQGHLRNLQPIDRVETSSQQSHIDLGRRHLRLGDYAQARRHFIASITDGGVTPEALTGIGLAEEGQGHLRDAERFFRKALRLAPDSIMAHNNLGVILFRTKKYHEAQQSFQSAFAISSGNSEIAEHNLRLANLAVAEIDANEAGAIEAHNLLRIGTSEYRLENTAVRVAKNENEATE